MKIFALFLVIVISILMFKFFTYEESNFTRFVEVVHFEEGSSCGKTCVSANRIYYVDSGLMKSRNVGSNRYWKGTTVEVEYGGSGKWVYFFTATLAVIVLLPVSFVAIHGELE